MKCAIRWLQRPLRRSWCHGEAWRLPQRQTTQWAGVGCRAPFRLNLYKRPNAVLVLGSAHQGQNFKSPCLLCTVRAPVTAWCCDLSGTVSHVLPACAQCQGRRGRPQEADPASLSPHCHPAPASVGLSHSSLPPSPGSGVCPCSPAGPLLTLTQLTACTSLLLNL